MLVESSHTMLLHRDFYCIVNSPYLDMNGELDPSLSSGEPLYLNKARLDEFRMIWFRCEIPQQIAHRIESDSLG